MASVANNLLDTEKIVTIKLERGKTGLGFNIKGGSDMQLIPGDDGIYVAKIKDDGAAAVDGRLKVGDRIVSVNGNSLVGVKHDVAVQTFVKAGANVNMEVVPGAEQAARKKLDQRDGKNSRSSKALIGLVIGVGVVTIVALYSLNRFRSGRRS